MNEKDVKWEAKSYGWRANLGPIRLFIHGSHSLMGPWSWGADYDRHRSSTLEGVMGSMTRGRDPDGITHVSGDAEDEAKAKHQAFLAAQYLLGTKLKKKAMGRGTHTVVGGKKREKK